jgi:two-component system, chemotaxis family, protein-glutamate methylesterase/glutaminase
VAFALVVVGASLGGLHALEILLAGLPAHFPLPVAIGQHRREDADDALCAALRRHSALPVGDAEDKEAIVPGRVYVAPAGYHLLVEEGRFALSTEAPVAYARPSIDVLFESAAEVYETGVIGVILTGASKDGSQGAARIKVRGGFVVVQDPRTAEGSVMPEAAIAATDVDRILPLAAIGPYVAALSHSGGR